MKIIHSIPALQAWRRKQGMNTPIVGTSPTEPLSAARESRKAATVSMISTGPVHLCLLQGCQHIILHGEAVRLGGERARPHLADIASNRGLGGR